MPQCCYVLHTTRMPRRRGKDIPPVAKKILYNGKNHDKPKGSTSSRKNKDDKDKWMEDKEKKRKKEDKDMVYII